MMMTRGERLLYRRRKPVLYLKSADVTDDMSWTCNTVCDRAGNNDALDATVGFRLCQGPSTTQNSSLGQTSRTSGSFRSFLLLIGGFDRRC